MTDSHYGRNGTLGLATPQANPTAETEFAALLPSGVQTSVARMTSRAAEPETRLRDYFNEIAVTLDQFDTLPFQAVGLACTGSSYLLGHEIVESNLAVLEKQRGHPIVSAAAAIERALRAINAKTIALLCPYPEWLLHAAEKHWQARGFQLVDRYSLDPTQSDTRAIYALSPTAAANQMQERWRNLEADAYLITGTGLPSLRVIADLSGQLSGPILSSNLCLAWATLRSAGIELAEFEPSADMPLMAGWVDRLEIL